MYMQVLYITLQSLVALYRVRPLSAAAFGRYLFFSFNLKIQKKWIVWLRAAGAQASVW
jgi:hypothetical protein